MICFGQFGDHLPRNISKAVLMLTDLANKGSAVGQQVMTINSSIHSVHSFIAREQCACCSSIFP